MEIEILKNTRTNRLILIDKSIGMAFMSLGRNDRIYKHLIEYHSEEIKDYKPITLKSK